MQAPALQRKESELRYQYIQRGREGGDGGRERLCVCILAKIVAHLVVQIHFEAVVDGGGGSPQHLRHQPFDQTRDPQRPSRAVSRPNVDCWARWLRGTQGVRQQVDTSLCPYHYETLFASWVLGGEKNEGNERDVKRR